MKNIEKELAAAREARRALTDLTEAKRVAWAEQSAANFALRHEIEPKFFAGEVDGDVFRDAKRKADRANDLGRTLDRKHRAAKNAFVETLHALHVALGLAEPVEVERSMTDKMVSDQMGEADEQESNVIRSST